jgi:hypothetical protein
MKWLLTADACFLKCKPHSHFFSPMSCSLFLFWHLLYYVLSFFFFLLTAFFWLYKSVVLPVAFKWTSPQSGLHTVPSTGHRTCHRVGAKCILLNKWINAGQYADGEQTCSSVTYISCSPMLLRAIASSSCFYLQLFNTSGTAILHGHLFISFHFA